MRLLIRIALEALAFMMILPMIPGIQVHGSFGAALGLAIFFSVMQWIVEIVAMAISAYMTVTTLGLALLFLIPMWIIGFWLLPGLALKLVADFLPQYLTVHGLIAAALGGLVLMVINTVTANLTEFKNRVRG